MKRENKHIDRVFQEKFKDFEASPNIDMWSKIEAQLDAKHPPKVLPLWLKLASVAASFVMLFLGWNFYQSNISSSSNVVNQETPLRLINIEETVSKPKAKLSEVAEKTEEDATKKDATQEMESIIIEKTNIKTVDRETLTAVTKGKDTTAYVQVRQEERGVVLAPSTPENELTKQIDTPTENSLFRESMVKITLALLEEKNSIEKGIFDQISTSKYSIGGAKVNDFTQEQAKQELVSGDSSSEELFSKEESRFELASTELLLTKSKPWSVKPQVSPVFNLAGNSGASVDPTLANNASQGNTSLSYGMLVTYQVASNLRIRSGVQQVNMAYTTNDVVLAPAVAGIASNQINFNATANGFNVFNELIYDASVTDQNARAFAASGNLQQQLGFVEIPMEVEWQLLEGKFGVYASGGASTLFLVQNSIGFRNETGLWNIGENATANSTSFSGNLGLGLAYQLTRRFNLNLEPSFRYQINTFSNQTEGFTPYFFALYSGVNFKF